MKGAQEIAACERLGQRLASVRQLCGLSQRELAKRSGVTNSVISTIEQGKVSPSIASLEKVLSGIPMLLEDFFRARLEGLEESVDVPVALQLITLDADQQLPLQMIPSHAPAQLRVAIGRIVLKLVGREIILTDNERFNLPSSAPFVVSNPNPTRAIIAFVQGR